MMLAVVLFFCSPIVRGADFGDLLSRLDSRDFSAEKNVLSGVGGPYIGETVNPHAETVMFLARDEFRKKMSDALNSADKTAELNAFIMDAMKQKVSEETKVWLLEQLSVMGTAKEVPALADLLKGKEKRIVDAAAVALSRIPGEEALAVLKSNQAIPAAKAALVCRLNPVPALTPIEKAMPFAVSNLSKEKVADWLKGYDKLAEGEQIRTLAGLTARNDKSYRSYALKALASDSKDLKKAGLLALEKMATKDDVDLLVSYLLNKDDLLAKAGVDKKTVSRICGFIVADGFDAALLAKLDATSDSKDFLELAAVLANRAVDIRANVFKKTMAADCPDRLVLLQMVCKVATKDDVPQLVASTVVIPRGREHDAAENLIAVLCNKDAAPVIKLLGQYPVTVIYPIMSRTSGDAAKAELSKGLVSSDPLVREAAFLALSNWADATFADKMLSILESDQCPENQYTRLLRGYIRVVSLPDQNIGVTMSRDEKLAKLKKAFTLAKGVNEKKLILSRLAANRTEKSMAYAVECAADPQLAEAAFAAIADHAHDTAIRKAFPAEVKKAIDLVIANSKNAKLIERVKIYKGRME